MSNQSSAPPQWVQDDKRHSILVGYIHDFDEQLEAMRMIKNGIVDFIEDREAEITIKRDEFYVELGEVKTRMRITREAAEHGTFDDAKDKFAALTLRAGIHRLIEENPGIAQHELYEKSGRHSGFYMALAKLQESKKAEKIGRRWYTREQRLEALLREDSGTPEVGCTCASCEYMRNADNDGET